MHMSTYDAKTNGHWATCKNHCVCMQLSVVAVVVEVVVVAVEATMVELVIVLVVVVSGSGKSSGICISANPAALRSAIHKRITTGDGDL